MKSIARPGSTESSSINKPHKAGPWHRVAMVLVAGALLFTACSTVQEILQLQQRIEREGYRNVSVNQEFIESSNGTVDVIADSGRGRDGAEGRSEIAEIVWETYPRRLDGVHVRLDGRSTTFDHDELEDMFGPRSSVLDEKGPGDEVGSTVRSIAVGILIFILVIIAAVVAGLLIWRSRKKKRPKTPPMSYQQYPAQQFPAQQYPPQQHMPLPAQPPAPQPQPVQPPTAPSPTTPPPATPPAGWQPPPSDQS